MKRFLIGFLILLMTTLAFATPNQHPQYPSNDFLINHSQISDISNQDWVNSKYPEIREYERDGFLIVEYIRERFEENEWVNGMKETYEYNEYNLLSSLHRFAWIDGDWQEGTYITQSYNETTHLLDESYQFRFYDDSWTNELKHTFEYDELGNLVEMLIYNGSYSSEGWNLSGKFNFEYDNGNLIEESYSDYDFGSDNFTIQGLTSRSYNADNQLIEEIYRSNENGEMINYYKQGFVYSNNLVIENPSWSWEDNEWVDNSRMLYSYNADNMFDVLNFQFWYEEQWENSQRRDYFYDDNNYLIEKRYISEFNESEENQSHHLYTNDQDGNVLIDTSENWEEGEWQAYDRYTSEYIPALTGSEDVTVPINELSNFPNPFNPVTTIKFSPINSSENAELLIYNVKGQMIKNFENLNNQNSVVWKGKDNDGNPIGSGIYFYQLNVDGEQKAIRKCLLLK